MKTSSRCHSPRNSTRTRVPQCAAPCSLGRPLRDPTFRKIKHVSSKSVKFRPVRTSFHTTETYLLAAAVATDDEGDRYFCLSESKAAEFRDAPENEQINLQAVEAAFRSFLMQCESRERHRGSCHGTAVLLVVLLSVYLPFSFTCDSSASLVRVQRFRVKMQDNRNDSHPERQRRWMNHCRAADRTPEILVSFDSHV